MSKLQELIEELCPEGVEYKEIEDICINIVSGGTPKTSVSEYYGGSIPWLRTQEVDWCDIYDTSVKITEAGLQNSSAKIIPVNCVIVAMYGATAAKVAINKIPLSTNQACCNLEIDNTIALYRYVYHYLQREYLNLKSMGQGSQSNINGQTIKNYLIPVPPLPVQCEIVRILDNFTELEKELEKELEARRKQYEYYRDLLLTFDSNADYNFISKQANSSSIRWMKLGDVGTLTRGKRFVKADAVEYGVPCIHYGELYTYYGLSATKTKSHVRKDLAPKLRYAEPNDVVIVGAGENDWDIGVGVAWLGKEKVAVHDACYIFRHNLNPRYVSHYLRTRSYHEQIKKYVSTGKICAISADGLSKAIIPIPSMEEQNRIADILDRFDALCNDLTSGLPAEIAARRKQYEYYRDKLLTFKEKEA